MNGGATMCDDPSVSPDCFLSLSLSFCLSVPHGMGRRREGGGGGVLTGLLLLNTEFFSPPFKL